MTPEQITVAVLGIIIVYLTGAFITLGLIDHHLKRAQMAITRTHGTQEARRVIAEQRNRTLQAKRDAARVRELGPALPGLLY